MSILSDKEIVALCTASPPLLTPFYAEQVRSFDPVQQQLYAGDSLQDPPRVISYGLTSFGYDMRAGRDWKIFTEAGTDGTFLIDPKAPPEKYFRDVRAEVGEQVIIPPNSYALTSSLEYVRMPEDVLGICLGKSTYARCFTGDTRVALVDGTAPALEEMVRRAESGEVFFGYGIQDGVVQVTALDLPRFVATEEVLEVELDSGEVVRCTPDHKWMLRDGSWAEASSLMAGQSLIPLYRKLYRGYEGTYQPLTGHMRPTHRMADMWNLRTGIYADLPGTHRHHKDGDRRNNSPWNIERMDAAEHLRMHNSNYYGEEFDAAEHGAAVSAAYALLRSDDAWVRRLSEQQAAKAHAFWHQERYAQQRTALAEAKAAYWTSAERKRHGDAVRAAHFNDSTYRERLSASSKQSWASAPDERRAQQAERARSIRLTSAIDENVVLQALQQTGSIRGAARLLGVDRSVFRRFPETLQKFRGASAHNHKVVAVRSVPGRHDTYCLTSETGNFALSAGAFVSNCGIHLNATPLEPGWEGEVTIEISNATRFPVAVYAGEGIMQVLFFRGSCPVVSYADRQGKYQGQQGITLAKL